MALTPALASAQELSLAQDPCVGVDAVLLHRILEIELGERVTTPPGPEPREVLSLGCQEDRITLTWRAPKRPMSEATILREALPERGKERLIALELVEFLELARRRKPPPPRPDPPKEEPPPPDPTPTPPLPPAWRLDVLATVQPLDPAWGAAIRWGGSALWAFEMRANHAQQIVALGVVDVSAALLGASLRQRLRTTSWEAEASLGALAGAVRLGGRANAGDVRSAAVWSPQVSPHAATRVTWWWTQTWGVTLGVEGGWWLGRAAATDGTRDVFVVEGPWAGAQIGVSLTY